MEMRFQVNKIQGLHRNEKLLVSEARPYDSSNLP